MTVANLAWKGKAPTVRSPRGGFLYVEPSPGRDRGHPPRTGRSVRLVLAHTAIEPPASCTSVMMLTLEPSGWCST